MDTGYISNRVYKSNRSKPIVLTQDLAERKYSRSPTDFTNAPMSPAPHKSFHGSAPRRDVAAMRAICPPPAKRVVETKNGNNGKWRQKWCGRICACENWRIKSDNSTNFTQSPWLHLPPAQPKVQPQSAVSELSINRFHQGWIFKLMSLKKWSKSRWKCGNSTHWGLLFGCFTNVHNLETAGGDKNWAACELIHILCNIRSNRDSNHPKWYINSLYKNYKNPQMGWQAFL